MSLQPQLIRVAIGEPPPELARAPSAPAAGPAPVPGATCQTPPIDIHEAPEGLILEADLPGVARDDLSVVLEDNVLELRAEVRPPWPEGARPLHEESRVAAFRRSFILSDEVERAKITAELANGVLRLTLPKAERARTRRIEVQAH
ncbi:MAG TPA: Hsp20/alpha crystallin family protein [Isosphaeraceae bacterium]|jgi:HSP20 family molecular chaperone IbpA|nr:Hsp20/alpha crystallin family protein [Isosphaeraceae bacterium]